MAISETLQTWPIVAVLTFIILNNQRNHFPQEWCHSLFEIHSLGGPVCLFVIKFKKRSSLVAYGGRRGV